MAVLTSKLIVSLVDQVTAPLRAINASLKSVQDGIRANNAAMDAMRGRVIEAGAVGYTLARAISSPVKAAMEFESAMADVRKVVDFDAPAEFQQFSKDVTDLSERIPMASKELTQIVAAAGQSGIPKAELLEFTKMAAKVGVAFDVSGSEAGEALAKMMTGLNLSIAGVSALSDSMNHLSNNGPAAAKDILDVVRRVGAAGKQFGFNATEVSAFAAAMVGAGAQSDVAATSFNNMGRALVRGSVATKAQRQAFGQLGLNANQVAKDMQRDAVGTTLRVLEAINRLPAEMQASTTSQLFGDEARALGPIITNLDLLKKNLGLVANEADYLGSAEREFQSRSATSENSLQLLANGYGNLSKAIGDALLPAVNDAATGLLPLIRTVREFVEANRALVRGIIFGAAGLAAFRVAATAAAWGGLYLKGSILQIASIGLKAARGLLMILNPVRLLTGAMGLLRVAMVGTGIGAILVAIGLAGAFIYNNWDGLSTAFSAFGDAFMAALGPAKPMVDSVISGFSELWSWVSSLVGPLDASQAQWANWGAGIGTTLGAIAADLPGAFAAIDWSGLWSQVSASLTTAITSWTALIGSVDWNGVGQLIGRTIGDGLAALLDIGTMLYRSIMSGEVSAGGLGGAIVNLIVTQVTSAWSLVSGVMTGLFGNINLQEAAVRMMETLWEGVKSMASKIADYLQSVLSSAISSIGSQARSLLSSITFGLAGSSEPARPIDGARASGGPVWGGGRFLVGEQGPELFSPSRSGFIIPAAATRALALASSLGAAAAPAHAINFDAYTLPEDVERAMMQPRAPGGGATAAQAPARNVTISPTIHINMSVTGVNDPDAIARELGRRVTERLEGALMDIDTGV